MALRLDESCCMYGYMIVRYTSLYSIVKYYNPRSPEQVVSNLQIISFRSTLSPSPATH
jgi:hypothetical protein